MNYDLSEAKLNILQRVGVNWSATKSYREEVRYSPYYSSHFNSRPPERCVVPMVEVLMTEEHFMQMVNAYCFVLSCTDLAVTKDIRRQFEEFMTMKGMYEQEPILPY